MAIVDGLWGDYRILSIKDMYIYIYLIKYGRLVIISGGCALFVLWIIGDCHDESQESCSEPSSTI